MEFSAFLWTRFAWGLDQLFQILDKQPARVRGTDLAFRTYHILQAAFSGLVGPAELPTATPKAKDKQKPTL